MRREGCGRSAGQIGPSGPDSGTATLLSLTPITPTEPQTDWRLRIQLPDALTRYVVPQGSITIEGISLTVASIVGNEVEVAIIPHTYAATSLHTLAPGSPLVSAGGHAALIGLRAASDADIKPVVSTVRAANGAGSRSAPPTGS